MAPAHWKKIKEIFDEALDVPPAERGPYLDRICATDPNLKSEVVRLLREHDNIGDFLAQPVVQPGSSLAPDELVAGRYRIKGLIGRGGMGEVYQAQDQLLHESVALKTLRADLTRDEGVVRRFLKEIQLARKVTHPNVCRVFEAGEHKPAGGPHLRFFTMELLSGETLSARIRTVQRLSREEAFPIAVQMAEGLHAAHEMGIVHADFKTGNVLLIPAPGGVRAVITDFGLARIDPAAADPEETVSMVAKVMGTVAYMSPEQMTGGAITTASDIYSFGIVLFEMATGQLPFDKRHLVNAAVQRVSGAGITARSLVPDIDPRWDAAIARCLQKDPARRFSSAADLADCFREGVLRMPRLYWTRRDWIRAGVAAGVPLAAGGGYLIRSHRPYQPQPAALDWYAKGVDGLHSMTYEAARKALEQAVAADPNFALAHASLARAYNELDNTERAKESMLRAVTAAQESRLSSTDLRRLRALQFTISSDYDRAAPLLQQLEAAADEREKAAAALESGWLAQQREKTDEAAAAYRRALKVDPRYAAAKLRLGFILQRQRQGGVEAALKTFKEAEDLYNAASDYEGVLETLLQQASLLNRSGRAAEAMPVIEKALHVAGTVGSTYQQIRLQLLQGTAARSLRDTSRAIDLALQAVEKAMDLKMFNLATSGLIDTGNAYLSRGDRKSAQEYYYRALVLAQQNKVNQARAQFQLGSLFERDKPEEALKYIDAALPFYRQGGRRLELISALGMLGAVQQRLADFDKGISTLREALDSARLLQDSQTEAQIRARLANALDEHGDWPEAVQENEEATKSQNPGIQTKLNLARLYWQLGQSERAQQYLSKVQTLLRQNPNAQLQLDLEIHQGEIAYRDGHMADARDRSRRALSYAPKGGVPEQRAMLIDALVLIRTRQRRGVESAVSVIEKFRGDKLAFYAESARLQTAEAVWASGDRSLALKMAREALAFFKQRRIWESVYRGNLVAIQASQESADVDIHTSDARSALLELRAIWRPPANVDTYRGRPDIKLLSSGMQF